MEGQIATLHRGKGFIVFTPLKGYDYSLEINLGGRNGKIRK